MWFLCAGFVAWAILIAWLAYKYEQQQIAKIVATANDHVAKATLACCDEAAKVIKQEREKTLQAYSDGWEDCFHRHLLNEDILVTTTLRCMELTERERDTK